MKAASPEEYSASNTQTLGTKTARYATTTKKGTTFPSVNRESEKCVLASKFYSRREVRGILSGQVSTASGAALIVDTPVPQGRRESGGGLHGFLQEQSPTAADVDQTVDFPVSRGLQGFPPRQSPTAADVEQIVRDNLLEQLHQLLSHLRQRSIEDLNERGLDPVLHGVPLHQALRHRVRDRPWPRPQLGVLLIIEQPEERLGRRGPLSSLPGPGKPLTP